MSVGELARLLPVSRPAVSQHLKALKSAGLVTQRRDGNRHLYAVDPAGIEMMRDYLDLFWNRALVSFKHSVEAAQTQEEEGQ